MAESKGTGGPGRHTSSLTLRRGGHVGVATLAGMTAVAFEAGALRVSVELDRGETRELALTLIDTSQHNGEE